MKDCPEDYKSRGKAESCKGCPNADICSSESVNASIEKVRNNIKGVKLKISVMSMKGGVGKSTIAFNIGKELSNIKIKTVVVDLDLSGSSLPRLSNTKEILIENTGKFNPVKINDYLSVISPDHFKYTTEELSFTSKVKNNIIFQLLGECNFEGFDVLIFDTPPNITDEHMALCQYFKVDYSILITLPSKLSIYDVERMVTFCNKAKIDIYGLIENQKSIICNYCNHAFSIGKPSLEVQDWCDNHGIRYLGSIPHYVDLAKSSDTGEMSFSVALIEKISLELQLKYLK